jgi:phosphoserine aminotransferase
MFLRYCFTHQDTLELPAEYEVAIVTGSNTAAYEIAMWNLLGPRDVHCIHFEAFGKNWYVDAVQQLKLNVTEHTCAYGHLPDISKVDFDADVLLTWNGTTSGVRMPDAPSAIPASRSGLTFVDATSAVFAMSIPWAECDVTTFSWQKALGGEGAHGVLVFSPRAMQRLREYTPPWPIPKLFRLKNAGKIEDSLFRGSVLNTVSPISPAHSVVPPLIPCRYRCFVSKMPSMLCPGSSALAVSLALLLGVTATSLLSLILFCSTPLHSPSLPRMQLHALAPPSVL